MNPGFLIDSRVDVLSAPWFYGGHEKVKYTGTVKEMKQMSDGRWGYRILRDDTGKLSSIYNMETFLRSLPK